MHTSTKRFIFVHFTDLLEVRFDKLELVCDKIFIFIHPNVQNIPFPLVRQLIKLGNGVKWIMVQENEYEYVHLHLSFLLGKLHQKISSDIEFAILTNSEIYDSLIHTINNESRNCIRVKLKDQKDGKAIHSTTKTDSAQTLNSIETLSEKQSNILVNENQHSASSERMKYSDSNFVSPTGDLEDEYDTDEYLDIDDTFDTEEEELLDEVDRIIVEETARDTVRRLIRSGNRPAEKENLKNYILIHNNDKSVQDNIEKVIDHLVEMKEIKINDKEIIYNF
ncbi:MAG: hypothetical protein KA010_00285 [Saprospiraceae bacterium]|nr:hypothetical protein [Saprospiraceae bacterium]